MKTWLHRLFDTFTRLWPGKADIVSHPNAARLVSEQTSTDQLRKARILLRPDKYFEVEYEVYKEDSSYYYWQAFQRPSITDQYSTAERLAAEFIGKVNLESE